MTRNVYPHSILIRITHDYMPSHSIYHPERTHVHLIIVAAIKLH